MSLRLYLILMSLVSVCAWVAWFIVVHAIDPIRSGFLGFFLFFVTLGVAVLASSTLLGTLVRVWAKQDEVVYRHVVRSLRQGIILTTLFLISLILSGLGLLMWWVLVLLVFIATILEIIFLGSTERA